MRFSEDKISLKITATGRLPTFLIHHSFSGYFTILIWSLSKFSAIIFLIKMWEKLLDFVYQDVKKILQLSEVTSVAAEYVELDIFIIDF